MENIINPMNTDIYDITETVNNLQKEVMQGIDEETLAVGMNGYLSSIQSMQIQNSIITASELGNEIFPCKAKFEKNIIAHAIRQNITDINATPAKMSVMIGVSLDELESLFKDNKFIFDKDCQIYVNNYEFHLQYDIILSRTLSLNNQFIYSAMYDNSRKNPLVELQNPYLQTPFIQVFDGSKFLFIYCDLIQIRVEKTQNKLVSSTPIENKVFEFSYEEQLAGFEVHVTENNKTTYLTPVFEGIGIEQDLKNYCFYNFLDSNNIRVTFDSASYMPSLNALIESEVWTTSGSAANFNYRKDFNTAITSDKYGYKALPVRIMIGTESSGGTNKKSTDELRKLIPKEALSRGSITNATSLANYFNMINTDTNRLEILTKVDNQFERSYFAYLVLKDSLNNVIPANTIDLKLKKEELKISDNRKYSLPAGTCLLLDRDSDTCSLVTDKDKINEYINNDKETFLYGLPLMIVMTDDPLYISYYCTVFNEINYLDFKFINQASPLQFVAPSISWVRNLNENNDTYKLDIAYTQNILNDFGAIKFDPIDTSKIINNMKVFIVLYNKDENTPYRYAEAKMMTYDYSSYLYTYEFEFRSTDQIDDDNKIRIENLKIPGSDKEAYGYMTSNVTANIYILNKFTEEYGRHDLDDIIPGLEGYTVCNMFTVNNGLNFYRNYTDIINSVVKHEIKREDGVIVSGYRINSIPVIKYSYLDDDENVQEFAKELNYKKAYIDNALEVLENNFGIDFKFFNTYGPSKIYSIDEKGQQLISRVNLTLKFRLKLLQSTDSYTVSYIIKDIKDILEDLNEITSLHIPNLITTITNNYRNSIEYFEFLGINDYGPGVQHLYKNEVSDPKVVPEFLTVHTNEDLTPDIVIELA